MKERSRKVVLKDAFKTSTLDQDKVLPPEETVRRFRERLKNVNLDILEGTVRIDNGRLGIPVYFSICGKDAGDITGTRKYMGKGATPEQSEASAVMELAERFSFFSFYKNPKNFLVEEYRNVKDHAISFESIALSVHDDSEDLDRAREVFSRIPLKWTWAYNLTLQEEVLVPFDWFFAINEHNGPAAGNCAEEALCQGICEVIERHVSSIISRNKLSVPTVNISSITDPVVRDMIGKYRKAGVRLIVSDFSLDCRIPTVGALAYDPSTFPDRSEIVWTAGTSPDPQKALGRALAEVAQLAGDFNTCSKYMASGLPKPKKLEDVDFVIHGNGEVDITELPRLSDNNIKVEVENCVSVLSQIGLEVIVVDIMHSELRIPAFYTIIPGAHFRERAAGTSVGMFSARMITENGKPEWAIAQLQKIDSFMPGKYYIKFFLGSCHLSINEPKDALRYFMEAMELDPREEDIASIYSYTGVCLKEMAQYREAIEVLQKAENHDHERTDIYNLMGFCYFKLKEHEKAIECFHKVINLNPGSAIDYANIASNYRDMGQKDLAIQYYQIALELDPGIRFARDNLRRLQQ